MSLVRLGRVSKEMNMQLLFEDLPSSRAEGGSTEVAML